MTLLYLTSVAIGLSIFIWALYTFKKIGKKEQQLRDLEQSILQRNSELKLYGQKNKKIDDSFTNSDGTTSFYSASDASQLFSGNIAKPKNSKTSSTKS